MALNLRRKKTLYSILTNKENISLSSLMDSYGISLRMARYDIKAMSEFLAEAGLPSLVLDKNGRLFYDVGSLDGKAVQQILDEIKEFSMEYLQPELRVFVLSASLLLAADQVTIDEMADAVNVSRNTVISDLANVRSWLSKNGVELISVPKYGLTVSGLEINIRRAYISLLHEVLPSERLATVYFEKMSEQAEMTYPDILLAPLASGIDFNQIQKYSTRIQRSSKVVFTDQSNADLVLALALSVFRIRQKRTIPAKEVSSFEGSDSGMYHAVSDCLKEFQHEFSIALPPSELGFITQCVQMSSILSSDTWISENSGHLEKDLFAKNLIAGVSRDFGINLHMDAELFHGIQAELIPMGYRMRHHVRMVNPLTAPTQRNYLKLYESVRKSTASLELFNGKGLSEDDISLLSMHFIAALERLHHTDDLPAVVVVCGFGLGSANILTTQFKKLFRMQLVGVIALRDLHQCLAENEVNLIITTVPIPSPPIPCVVVSPFLSDQDIVQIGRCLMDIHGKRKLFLPEVESEQPGLLSLLTRDLMDLDYPAADFYDAIRRSGELLHAGGMIDEDYISAMISAVKDLGPYIVFMPGFALAHARAGTSVHRPGVSFVRLRDPVVSGHPSNDPVRVIFALALTGKGEQDRTIIELSRVISSDAGRLFLSAKSQTELLELINIILKSK